MVLKSANLSSILMIVVFTFLQYVARAWRWAILLEPIQTTGFRNRIQAVLIGFAANCVFPARLGEFIRANLLGRKEKLSGSSILGTILVERLFDGFTLLLILAIGLSGTTFTGEWSAVSGSLRGTGYALFFTYLLVILFIVGFKYKTRECLNLLDRLLFFFLKKLRKKSIEAIRNFSLGLVLLESRPLGRSHITFHPGVDLWNCTDTIHRAFPGFESPPDCRLSRNGHGILRGHDPFRPGIHRDLSSCSSVRFSFLRAG